MDESSRHLYLLRHAHASWEEGVADRDRPLSPRGRRQAEELDRQLDRRWLGAPELRPGLLLVSPAARTRETLRRMPASLGGIETRFEDRLWGATPRSVLDLLHGLPGAPGSLLVLGHEPWITGLARVLCPSGPPSPVPGFTPPAGLLHLEVPRLRLDPGSAVFRGSLPDPFPEL